VDDLRHVSGRGRAAVARACAWCGPLVVLICAVGLLVPGFVPPPSAALSAEEVAGVFRESTTAVRLGIMAMVIGSAFLGVFFAAVSAQLRRIEGPRPILTYAQLLLGTCFVMEIIFPAMAVQVAAFRPERVAVLQQLLNDLCWLTFFGVTSTAVVQWIVIGVAILQDDRPSPVFPRWAAYFNIWAALMLTPGTVVMFFKSGPLSWTGLFVFWLPFTAFFAWLMVMFRLLLKAIGQERADDAAAERSGSDPERVEVESLSRQLAQVTGELEIMRERLNRVESQPIP
jgi:hypothetical protein